MHGPNDGQWPSSCQVAVSRGITMSPADDWRVETGEGGDGHCSARCILGIHTVNRAGALKVGAAFAQRARFRPFCLASLSGLITSRTDNRAYIMANMPYPPLI